MLRLRFTRFEYFNELIMDNWLQIVIDNHYLMYKYIYRYRYEQENK